LLKPCHTVGNGPLILLLVISNLVNQVRDPHCAGRVHQNALSASNSSFNQRCVDRSASSAQEKLFEDISTNTSDPRSPEATSITPQRLLCARKSFSRLGNHFHELGKDHVNILFVRSRCLSEVNPHR